MGFYNMLQGDAPYFKFLADNYAMSDNFAGRMGGTGANHVMLGTGDGSGLATATAIPPRPRIANWSHRELPTLAWSMRSEPRPQAGTNNWYSQMDTAAAPLVPPPTVEVPPSNCSDTTAPGFVSGELSHRCAAPSVKITIRTLLSAFLYNPGYYGDAATYADIGNPSETVFTIPPSPLRNIGDALNEKGIVGILRGSERLPN